MPKDYITRTQKYKKLINKLKEKSHLSLNSPEMVKVSQKLDKLIVRQVESQEN